MLEKKTLTELYINQNLLQKEIAKKLNVSITTIRKYIRKYGITKKDTFEDIEKVILQYNPEAKLLSFNKKSEPCLIQCSCGNNFKRKIAVIEKFKKCLCYNCSGWKGASNGLSKKYVENFIESHGCKLLSEYIDSTKKLSIKCSCGKIFKQTFEVFRKGEHHGCVQCFHIKAHDKQRFSNKEVKKIIEESGCKWISGEYQNLKSPLGIGCFECKEEYVTSLDKFVYQHKIRCNNCSSNRSTYELYTNKLLSSLNIEFVMDKHLEGAYGIKGGRLRFDFIILNNGKPVKVIEVDGIQHNRIGGDKKFFNDKQSFEERMKNDKLKEIYCIKQGLPLLRISYKLFRSKKKKEILEKELLDFIYSKENTKAVS